MCSNCRLWSVAYGVTIIIFLMIEYSRTSLICLDSHQWFFFSFLNVWVAIITIWWLSFHVQEHLMWDSNICNYCESGSVCLQGVRLLTAYVYIVEDCGSLCLTSFCLQFHLVLIVAHKLHSSLLSICQAHLKL